MKIVISAWHLKNRNVGIGRYTYHLIESLGRVDRINQYEILIPLASHDFQPWPNVRYHLIRFPVFKRRVWEQLAPLMVGNYDILHFPYDSCIGIKRGKFVVTFHDAKPLLFPQTSHRWSWNQSLKNILAPRPFQQIDHVITVSECSRRDLIEQLGIAKDRMTVIYQGVDLEKFSPLTESTTERFEFFPYVLCVAGTDPTKNVKSLIDAFSRLPAELRSRQHLVLVGDVHRNTALQELVKKHGIAEQTVFTGKVPDSQLVALYQQASVFVFPSFYEGFGLPVLEAMACGCPVITSNTSSLPEVVGEAGILVNPYNTTELVEAMTQVLTDASLAQVLRARGRVQAQKFSWEKTARATADLYEKIGRGET
ncbi:MAG: glycosyltransferase family 4 protein [Nitrospirota bacterium]|nr:glycosyltransferase family 4 protein [Nitrospirota bacterium]